MANRSPELLAHLEWLGYIQPVGLVVSAPALLNAQAHINKNILPEHRRFLEVLPKNEDNEPIAEVADFHSFVQSVFGWEREDLLAASDEQLAASLEVVLPEYNETLRPDYVVVDSAASPTTNDDQLAANSYIALVKEYDSETQFDDAEVGDSRRWQASPHSRMERLLRETGVPFGILTNGRSIRLVYAPRGETSGYLTFNLDEMITVAGRPIFAAMHMLLSAPRMFTLDKNQRLPAILEDSRKYQNTVSTELAEQVMAALFHLLRGFQSASDATGGQLLGNVLAKNPQHVYHALVTVLMRMVFVLYAEDRGLISNDPVYGNHYSVSGLFERLRQDAGRFPDTMGQRFGAWAQLLALFRMIYEGGSHDELRIPAREGYLFDYQRFPFLEGRFDDGNPRVLTQEEIDSPINVPRVSDGIVYSMLNNLLILQGERLSYRTLDVEQIGSVYEAIMGFSVEVSSGKSIAIKPVKKYGAPSTINLEELLAVAGKDRSKWIKERADQKLSAGDAKNVKAANTIDELLDALDKKIAKQVTPDPVPAGAMIFQPSDERRRSGSHYTPRSLTEPIVKTTLGPILGQLLDASDQLLVIKEEVQTELDEVTSRIAKLKSHNTKLAANSKRLTAKLKKVEKSLACAEAAKATQVPHPRQILQLKICDPAMGSGAFLVEACRQLAEELVKSWHVHSQDPQSLAYYRLPTIPPDEDELLYARRLIVQRCLYGVDKNFMAVELAKLSLWLVTLAADHAFTFLDHSLCFGDSLVGLTREQIIGFHWERKKFKTLLNEPIQKRLDRATEARAKILNAREDVPYKDQQQRLALADDALELIRELGNACVSCFFAESKKKAREDEVDRVYGHASEYVASLPEGKAVARELKAENPELNTGGVEESYASRKEITAASARLKESPHPIPAFHWEIEFPEVFARENGGFDAFVGNPPFAGKNTLINGNRDGYLDWLKSAHPESHGNSDLVAHFFRRSFDHLRTQGCFGLIATNTIRQGDTRSTGLRWICLHGGQIFHAKKRFLWPGVAAVEVSIVHICKSTAELKKTLDRREVGKITAYLFHQGGSEDPHPLRANDGKSFQGSIVLGMGFTFDDGTSSQLANSIARMNSLIEADPRNTERIFPYIGGEEINSHPTQSHDRFVIDFANLPEDEVRREWPALYDIVLEKVKPQRLTDKRKAYRKYWWQFAEKRGDLRVALRKFDRVLAISEVTSHIAFAMVNSKQVFAHTLKLLMLDDWASFAVMQSTVHERWARFFGSSLETRFRYTATDCFETFPFPKDHDQECGLQEIGGEYNRHRAQLMADNDEGMTKTYNRFHDPHEQSEGILELRRLHCLMDGAVLRAYGWDDLAESACCEFLLDYEEEESDEPGAKKSKKKKPWRYRWPDEFRDEVLARLLELNEQRHQEELLAGGIVKGKKTAKPKDDSTDKKPQPKGLFDDLPELDANEKLILMAVQEIGTMTRFTLDNAFCLLKSNKCRKAILGLGEPPARTPNVPTGMDGIVGRLIKAKWLRVIPSESQQILTLGEVESPLGALSKSDRTKIEEVKQVFAQELAKTESKLDQFEVEDDLVGETNALKIKKGVFHAKESLLV